MRVSNVEKQKSRSRIVEAASRRFREAGIEGTGLSDIMKDAGMTHGGFYKHFEDKDALVQAALAEAFERFVRPLAEAQERDAVDSFRNQYLSPGHRDAPGLGCPVAALASDVARGDPATRKVMNDGVLAMLAQLARHRGEPEAARATAINDLATMVGAIVIARAVEPPLSHEVLVAVRNALFARGEPVQA